MNKARREALSKVQAAIQDAKSDLEGLRDKEQEYYDNMPESLHSGERGQVAEEAIDNIDDAINSLGEADNSVGEALA